MKTFYFGFSSLLSRLKLFQTQQESHTLYLNCTIRMSRVRVLQKCQLYYLSYVHNFGWKEKDHARLGFEAKTNNWNSIKLNMISWTWNEKSWKPVYKTGWKTWGLTVANNEKNEGFSLTAIAISVLIWEPVKPCKSFRKNTGRCLDQTWEMGLGWYNCSALTASGPCSNKAQGKLVSPEERTSLPGKGALLLWGMVTGTKEFLLGKKMI